MADDLTGRLCDAAYQNDLDGARKALADGADVRARAERGGHPARTPLGWARTAAMAALLLDAGAEVDAEDAEGYTPLFRVLSHKWLEPVEVLLARGANPNHAASPTHVPPVDMALQVSPPVGLRLLHAGGQITPNTRARLWLHDEARAVLDEWPIRGAKLADRDKELLLAARAGNLDAVTALLRDGADVTARDSAGTSGVEHALQRQHVAVARVLERAVLATADGATLFLAVLDDDGATIQAKASTFDLEARTPQGLTPLMLAARYRRHAALRALLSLNVNLEQRNGAKTALVYAIESGDLFGMLQLLDHLAAFNVPIDGTNPVLDAACAQRDTDLLKHLLDAGLDLAPYPAPTGYGETARLLKNARAGLLPQVAPPQFASWSACTICRDLPDAMGWCRTMSGEHTGDGIPAVTEQFETYDGDLWKCPHCATYYEYERSHDNGIPDGWDSEDVRRLTLDVARKRLEGISTRTRPVLTVGERQRIERELARATFAEALATPGRKVHVSADGKDGARGLLIYQLAPGAEEVARHWLPEAELDAVVAELEARGVERAETDFDSMNDLVWIPRGDGLEVFDDKRKILELAGDRATLLDGSQILRADIANVIAYASDDYVERGVKVVLRSGQEVGLVVDYRAAYYQYNRNDLLWETAWCAHIGHAIARWAGTGCENLV